MENEELESVKLRFLEESFESERMKSDSNVTDTSIEQCAVEDSIHQKYEKFKEDMLSDGLEMRVPLLEREKHIHFLVKGLKNLGKSYECLDASRPWLCYWILHSLELLNVPIPDDVTSSVASFLNNCQCPEGGFAGGPGQHAHLATTYAAVNALIILGTEEAYKVINREKLQQWLMRVHQKDGSFIMHEGGEVDVRGAYCAAAVARLVNVQSDAMFDMTCEWIVSCQTYEGGFAGCPGMEAHGGYAFCALAALVLLGHERLCDIDSLLRWASNRQMRFEGGFQGRTNKLVDGCYSFWQGGIFPVIHMVLTMSNNTSLSAEKWLFHQGALQEYLLICCQHPLGGLIDKPGKSRDYYHTCYTLSGLSVAQHFGGGNLANTHVVGDGENELQPTHPLFNICNTAVTHAKLYFDNLPVPKS